MQWRKEFREIEFLDGVAGTQSAPGFVQSGGRGQMARTGGNRRNQNAHRGMLGNCGESPIRNNLFGVTLDISSFNSFNPVLQDFPPWPCVETCVVRTLVMKSESAAASPALSSPTAVEVPWWKQLNRYHWFVFSMASLAWLFDCLDQQLFLLARNGAMKSLLPPGTDFLLYGSYATTIFVAGWATGGLIFGAIGDRIGRAKTLAFT